MTGFLHILAAWFICFCLAWKLHSLFFVGFMSVLFFHCLFLFSSCFQIRKLTLVLGRFLLTVVETCLCVPIDPAPFLALCPSYRVQLVFLLKTPSNSFTPSAVFYHLYVNVLVEFNQLSDFYWSSSSLFIYVTLLSLYLYFLFIPSFTQVPCR